MLLCVRCNNLEAAPPEEDIVSANLLCNKFPVLTKNKKRQQRAATKQKQRAKQLQPFFTCPKNIVRENSPPFFVFILRITMKVAKKEKDCGKDRVVKEKVNYGGTA